MLVRAVQLLLSRIQIIGQIHIQTVLLMLVSGLLDHQALGVTTSKYGSVLVLLSMIRIWLQIIGLMMGLAFLIAGITALPTERAKRYMAPHWIVLLMIILTALGNGLVPLFEGISGLTFSTILFVGGVGLGMAYVLMLLS